ncbi:hypothetical protein CRE_18420 [Caenorhabditis remanei]|uniref:Uncharacterized protein n=1 Tax=Caenorhabditis remanei TaxID=31234 RepID=E3LK54_CAERE|nr:hypothetical protein CRE_18420 [Caenorhabditis remanei]
MSDPPPIVPSVDPKLPYACVNDLIRLVRQMAPHATQWQWNEFGILARRIELSHEFYLKKAYSSVEKSSSCKSTADNLLVKPAKIDCNETALKNSIGKVFSNVKEIDKKNSVMHLEIEKAKNTRMVVEESDSQKDNVTNFITMNADIISLRNVVNKTLYKYELMSKGLESAMRTNINLNGELDIFHAKAINTAMEFQDIEDRVQCCIAELEFCKYEIQAKRNKEKYD